MPHPVEMLQDLPTKANHLSQKWEVPLVCSAQEPETGSTSSSIRLVTWGRSTGSGPHVQQRNPRQPAGGCVKTLELLRLSVSSSDLHFCEFYNYITTAEHTHILEINVLGVYIKMFLLVCIYNQDTLGLPWWCSGWESALQGGDMGLIPGLGRSHMPQSN